MVEGKGEAEGVATVDVEEASAGSSGVSNIEEEESVQETLAKGDSLKMGGNEHMKHERWEDAKAAYQSGLKKTSNMAHLPELSPLVAQLNTNLALTLLKLNEFREAEKAASAALDIDTSNLKARHRRAVARRHMGKLEDARADVRFNIQRGGGGDNEASRQELRLIQAEFDKAAKAEKTAYGGFLKKSGFGLYDDRQRQTDEKIALEVVEREKRRAQWKTEADAKCDDSFPSFDDWERQRKESADAADEAKAQRAMRRATNAALGLTQKESDGTSLEPPQRIDEACASAEEKCEAPRTAPASPAPVVDMEVEIDLDDEERKVLAETRRKGYCYFRRELTEEEKMLRETEHRPTPVSSEPPETPPSASQANALSSWNVAGTTYEERDTSSWVIDEMRKRCQSLKVSQPSLAELDRDGGLSSLESILSAMRGCGEDAAGAAEAASKLLPYEAEVTEIKDISGDAQVAIVRGEKRYVYDISLSLKVVIKIEDGSPDSSGKICFNSILTFGDLSSQASREERAKECRASALSRKKGGKSDPLAEGAARIALDRMKEKVLDEVEEFEKIYCSVF